MKQGVLLLLFLPTKTTQSPWPLQHHQALHTRTLKAGLDCSDLALLKAWRDLAEGGTRRGTGWTLFGYDDGGANAAKCVVVATGSGIVGLLSALREDQVCVWNKVGRELDKRGCETGAAR